MTSPGRAPERSTISPCGTRPRAATDTVSRPGARWCRRRGAGCRSVLVGLEAAREAPIQLVVQSRGRREGQEVADRARALGGEVGEVDAQRLLGDRAGRIVGEEMDTGGDQVGLEDEVLALGGV